MWRDRIVQSSRFKVQGLTVGTIPDHEARTAAPKLLKDYKKTGNIAFQGWAGYKAGSLGGVGPILFRAPPASVCGTTLYIRRIRTYSFLELVRVGRSRHGTFQKRRGIIPWRF